MTVEQQPKQPSPEALFAQGLREAEPQRRQADRAATAARDPKREYAANFTYPLPPDAAAKLGDDENQWNAEATRMSLQHRWDTGMKMNPTELMTLGMQHSTPARAG